MPQVRTLGYADTLRVRAKGPFDFRRTFWKPSRFVTGLEVHTLTDSWRTFRVGRSSYGVHAWGEEAVDVAVDVYTDDEWNRATRGAITRRLTHSYGLDDDPSDFIARAREVPALRGPLEALMNPQGGGLDGYRLQLWPREVDKVPVLRKAWPAEGVRL
jgi:hypothetical protein